MGVTLLSSRSHCSHLTTAAQLLTSFRDKCVEVQKVRKKNCKISYCFCFAGGGRCCQTCGAGKELEAAPPGAAHPLDEGAWEGLRSWLPPGRPSFSFLFAPFFIFFFPFAYNRAISFQSGNLFAEHVVVRCVWFCFSIHFHKKSPLMSCVKIADLLPRQFG